MIDTKAFWKNQRLLVISPHPDDEVFGCGGTMAKAKALGCGVYVMIFSVGDLKFYEKKSLVKAKKRVGEVARVAKILQWDGYEIIYEDTEKHLRLDALPQRDLIAKIEKESTVSMEKVKPTMIAIPAPSYNQDHRAVYEAAFAANRIHAGGSKVIAETVLVYESPTLSWSPKGKSFRPNFYVDISDYLAVRRRTIQTYVSQRRDSRDPCGLENLEDLARVRGREAGRGSCEAYELCRFIV